MNDAVVVLLGPTLCVVEGAGTNARGRSLAGILGRHLQSPHQSACGEVHRVFKESLWSESGIRVHQGGPQQLQLRRQWCGGVLSVAIVASRFCELFLGHQDFVAQLEMLTAEHQTLLPHSIGSGCAGSVAASGPLCCRSCTLRGQSGGARICRTILPEARCWIVAVSVHHSADLTRSRRRCVGAASMPLVLGGLGVAIRVQSEPACLLGESRSAAQLVTALDNEPESRFLCTQRELGGEGCGGCDGVRTSQCATGSATRSQRTRVV